MAKGIIVRPLGGFKLSLLITRGLGLASAAIAQITMFRDSRRR